MRPPHEQILRHRPRSGVRRAYVGLLRISESHATPIPHADRAIVDIRKLRDYCLNPGHDDGQHKARVFVAALGLTIVDANAGRAILLEVIQTHQARLGYRDAYGQRFTVDFWLDWQGNRTQVCSGWVLEHGSMTLRLPVATYQLRRVVRRRSMLAPIKLLDIVALTEDLPEQNLWRGQVGTVMEILAAGAAYEVEFCDRDGRPYASLGLRPEQLMVLHHEPASLHSS